MNLCRSECPRPGWPPSRGICRRPLRTGLQCPTLRAVGHPRPQGTREPQMSNSTLIERRKVTDFPGRGLDRTPLSEAPLRQKRRMPCCQRNAVSFLRHLYMGQVKAHADTGVGRGRWNLENGVRSPQPPRQSVLMLAAPLLPAKGHLLPRPGLSPLGVRGELFPSAWKPLLPGTCRDLGNSVTCPCCSTGTCRVPVIKVLVLESVPESSFGP